MCVFIYEHEIVSFSSVFNWAVLIKFLINHNFITTLFSFRKWASKSLLSLIFNMSFLISSAQNQQSVYPAQTTENYYLALQFLFTRLFSQLLLTLVSAGSWKELKNIVSNQRQKSGRHSTKVCALTHTGIFISVYLILFQHQTTEEHKHFSYAFFSVTEPL